jgi:hypothetical protein
MVCSSDERPFGRICRAAVGEDLRKSTIWTATLSTTDSIQHDFLCPSTIAADLPSIKTRQMHHRICRGKRRWVLNESLPLGIDASHSQFNADRVDITRCIAFERWTAPASRTG